MLWTGNELFKGCLKFWVQQYFQSSEITLSGASSLVVEEGTILEEASSLQISCTRTHTHNAHGHGRCVDWLWRLSNSSKQSGQSSCDNV